MLLESSSCALFQARIPRSCFDPVGHGPNVLNRKIFIHTKPMLFSELLCSSGELGNAKVTSVYLRRDNIHSSQCLDTFHLYFKVPYYSEISFLLCDCNIAPDGT